MHAYLLVGQGEVDLNSKADELVKKLKAKKLLYPLKKIDDARELGSFVSLKVPSPTAIYIKGIEGATPEALNAFLKNLEEPQENLYFILTATSAKKVLPTIVSRCQVIPVNSKQQAVNSGEIKNFLNMSIGEKLGYVDKIRDRGEAIKFIQEFIAICHDHLHKTENHSQFAKLIVAATSTFKNLKANGNVNLQLTNFVICIV